MQFSKKTYGPYNLMFSLRCDVFPLIIEFYQNKCNSMFQHEIYIFGGVTQDVNLALIKSSWEKTLKKIISSIFTLKLTYLVYRIK